MGISAVFIGLDRTRHIPGRSTYDDKFECYIPFSGDGMIVQGPVLLYPSRRERA